MSPEAAARRPGQAPTLSPAEVQLVFRAVLEALARPGTPRQLPERPLAELPSALLPVLALSDLATPTCVLENGDRWARTVRTMTSAPMTGPADARLVAVLRQLADGEPVAFRTGSAAAPQDAALVCVRVPEIEAEPAGPGPVWRLEGPGVPGSRLLRVAGLPDGFVSWRDRLGSGFPTGIDLLFVTARGRLAGLPRTTRVGEEVI